MSVLCYSKGEDVEEEASAPPQRRTTQKIYYGYVQLNRCSKTKPLLESPQNAKAVRAGLFFDSLHSMIASPLLHPRRTALLHLLIPLLSSPAMPPRLAFHKWAKMYSPHGQSPPTVTFTAPQCPVSPGRQTMISRGGECHSR